MKKFLYLATIATSLVSASALASDASSCHFHGNAPAAEKVVIECAVQRKTMLINSGKLDKSWDTVKHEKIEQVDGKKGREWKVSFKNPAATEPSKATLFVFMSLPGNYVAANFTGQ